MKQIKLTQGKFALVDDCDYDELNRFRWQVLKTEHATAARRACCCPFTKKQYTILMHRQIMSCPRGMEIDHINHNDLDNRKQNLRICTRAQNMQNKRRYKSSLCEYKGINKRPCGKKWRARIRLNGEMTCLGDYNSPKEAAIAYNVAAKEVFGEYAHLNKI